MKVATGKPQLRGIYGITDDHLMPAESLLVKVQSALDAGISMLQYRSKSTDRQGKKDAAQQLLAICRGASVPLIINDDVDLCLDIGGTGVHLGKQDRDIHSARRALGKEAIIGVTCHNSIATAINAQAQGADYVAFGRFFPSGTKPEASSAELETLAAARLELRIPIVAIGGVNAENGASLIAAGADMLAAVHALFGDSDVAGNARQLVSLFKSNRS